MSKVPILVVGDSVALRSGLGRICRDLMSGLWDAREVLGIDLAHLGWDYLGEPTPWPSSPIRDHNRWGRADLIPAWTRFFGNRRGAIFTIWDPARCFELIEPAAALPIQLWGYFAIDAETATGDLGTIGNQTVRQYRRVLAYGRWGSKILECVLGREVDYLPHGLHSEIWTKPRVSKAADGSEVPLPRILCGCVAANIPRKDFPLLFDTWARMGDRRQDLVFWLHTNSDVGPTWSVPELISQFGLTGRVLVTGVPPEEKTDDDLATLYHQCLVTIAPGPEGFGYPIVESLAGGAPVVGVDYAGGAELIPRSEWRASPAAWRYESVHCLKRPVLSAQGVANAALAAATLDDAGRGVLAGSVAHLDWGVLWGSWQKRFAEWLEELR